MIIIDSKKAIEGFKELGKGLSGKNWRVVISRTINRSLMQGRTVGRRKISSIYNIPQRKLSGIELNSSSINNLRGEIRADGSPIPLSTFEPTFITPTRSIKTTRRGKQKVRNFSRKKRNPGKGVWFQVLNQGGRVQLPFTFMTPERTGVYARGKYNGGTFDKRYVRVSSSGNDLPIQSMVSASVHNSIMNPESMETITDTIEDAFPRLLEHEIKYRIGKINATQK